jgi:ATP-dependent RNA helicase SUPV3L1/SUV3
MVMNLPIRRVVFCEQEKFDGRSRRMLEPQEIQQIAGRAGRFGRYAEGLFAASGQGSEIRRRYLAQVPDISEVPVGIPEDICLVRDATLSDAIIQWMAIEQPAPFKRIDVERDLELIMYAQGLVDEGRRMNTSVKTRILALAHIPFDVDNARLAQAWQQMAATELRDEPFEVEPPPEPVPGTGLATLEADYRLCDLLYTYARTFGYHDREQPLMALRSSISRAIMDLLADA